jgi:hypothetical protein
MRFKFQQVSTEPKFESCSRWTDMQVRCCIIVTNTTNSHVSGAVVMYTAVKRFYRVGYTDKIVFIYKGG